VISVSITKTDETLLLRLWNDGSPIAEEIKDRLFEPFHKGHKGEFGLGLSIVKRIANLHDSEVWAVNEDNGVAFYTKVPLPNEKFT
jgi:two-component system sensor histidine kinase CssS